MSIPVKLARFVATLLATVGGNRNPANLGFCGPQATALFLGTVITVVLWKFQEVPCGSKGEPA